MERSIAVKSWQGSSHQSYICMLDFGGDRLTMKGRYIGRTRMCYLCQNICGYCQRHMLCKLANPLTKHNLLVIGQIQDGFSTLRNKSSSLVLKPYKTVQKTNEEGLFIKALQIARQIHFYRGLMMDLYSSSTEAVSIKNYEIQISRSNFMHILVYLCRISFLTTLVIYKDYFKGHLNGCKVMQLNAN